MERLYLILASLLTTFTLLATGNTYTELPDSAILLNEVSVSGLKSGNNLKNIAQSSTIINRKLIERDNIVSLKGVSEMVPNFFIPDYGSRITSSIYVRGLGARIDQPVVGLNIDNVPILNKDSYDLDVPDIAKAEILRGPQSTLYGRNTMGGLINLYTLSPLNYQGWRFSAEYSRANSYKVTAGYYTKIRNNLGLSLSGNYTSTDGFFTNEYTGKKCDDERMGGGRIKLQWNANSKLSVHNVLAFSILRQGGYPYQSISSGEISYNDECFYHRFNLNDGVTIKYQLSKFSLSSITSFQYIDDNMTLDQDFLPVSYFTLTQKKKEYSFTEDFVLKSLQSNNYKWITGAYAFYKHTHMLAPVTFKDYGIENLILSKRNEMNPEYPCKWNEDSFILGSDFTNPVIGVSLYHQSKYDINKWHFSAGIRFDYEHISLDATSSANTSYTVYHKISETELEHYRDFPIVINDRNKLSKDYFQILPQVSALMNFGHNNQCNVYASISRGYKAGGYNTQMFSDVLQQKLMKMMGIGHQYDIDDVVGYKPESSWNYEIGSHIECNNKKVKTDIALFYIDCIDQQLTVFPDGTTTGRIMTNAGKTRSYGAEISISYSPTQHLSTDVSYGYTNAKFVTFDNGKNDYSGKYIPYSPQNTVYAHVGYDFCIGNKWIEHIILNANVKCIGKIYWNEENDVAQPLYGLLGASVTFKNDKYSLDFWGRNLTNTKYNTFYFVSIGNGFLQQGKPYNIGATLRINI